MPGTLDYLTLTAVKEYLRIATADVIDDALLTTVMLAVEAQQMSRLSPDAFVAPMPDDVTHAALMRCARLYMRRASPEGLVGIGDIGVARVPVFDRDIDALEAPWRNVVLA